MKVFRLTENDLHTIIEDAVRTYLQEDGEGAMDGATSANISADAMYTTPISPVQRRKFYGDTLKRNKDEKNGSISMNHTDD